MRNRRRASFSVLIIAIASTGCTGEAEKPHQRIIAGPRISRNCVDGGCFNGADASDGAATPNAGLDVSNSDANAADGPVDAANIHPDSTTAAVDVLLMDGQQQAVDTAVSDGAASKGDSTGANDTDDGVEQTFVDANGGDSTGAAGDGANDSAQVDAIVTDGEGDAGSGPAPCSKPCDGACCAANQLCLASLCVTPAGTCADSGDCSDDHGCLDGVCLPWGKSPLGHTNNLCEVLKPPGVFRPKQHCAWTGPPKGDKHPNHRNVLGTPIVIATGGFSDSLDPSIVFVSYDKTDGGGAASACAGGAHGVIRVIRGADCSQQHSLAQVKVRAATPVAAGDLDGDGRPEIAAISCAGGIVTWRYDNKLSQWKLLWHSTPVLKGGLWQGPSIHDLDDDGKAEVLADGIVLSHSGKVLDSSVGQLAYSVGVFPVVADVDVDNKPELLTGDLVYEWSKKTNKWLLQHKTGQPRGHVAVADFGRFGDDPAQDDRSKLDGVAEVAVVTSGKARVQTAKGRVIFGPVALPGGGTGGPPTLGDFDKDGRVELALAGLGAYTVFDMDCVGAPQKQSCPTLSKTGVLWTSPSKDHSSSVTGSSIFDFEGDGKAEGIYADECFARVYEGSTGEVLFSAYHTSCTWYENPIVADVDGDFKSELVVPNNNNCSKYKDCLAKLGKLPGTNLPVDPVFKGLRCKVSSDCAGGGCDAGFCRCTKDAHCGVGSSYRCGPMLKNTPGKGNVCRSVMLGVTRGIAVYRDSKDRWVDSRPIWNQHAYSITNVGPGGGIPLTSAWAPNWKQPGLNNFRQNQQGAMNPLAAPDFTAKLAPKASCANGEIELTAKACNRGLKSAKAGLKVSFRFGPPKAGPIACIAQTKKTLVYGKCETVKCKAKPPKAGKLLLSVTADDDGKGKGVDIECHESNNASTLLLDGCP